MCLEKLVYLYTVLNESYINKYPGVNKKVDSQVTEFNRAGIKTDLKVICYEPMLKRMLPFHTSSIDWMHFKVWEDYDGLYLRYPMSDYQMLRWFHEIKKHKPKFKIVIEIPTFPYDKELNQRNKLIIFRDEHYRNSLKKNVDRIVVNNGNNEVFGVPAIITPNGIDLKTVRKRKPVEVEGNKMNLCFVAAFAMWHGADRLLNGLRDYYRSGGQEDIVVHMVGNGEENVMNPLKALAMDKSISERIKFYGFMDGEELSRMYDKCQLAVASLGLHRLQIDAPSTLKSREYLARGIPFIYSSEIADFKEHPVNFAFQISADDTPVNFFEVVKFYRNLLEKNHINDLTSRIRKYAEDYVSIEKTMKPIVDYYQANDD